MSRVTNKQIENAVKAINLMLKRPIAPYTRHDDGTFTPNSGNVHIGEEQNWYGVHVMCENSSGVNEIGGGNTKPELYKFLRGMQAALYEVQS